jgi:PAS domain S-box-containing protein
MSPRRFRPPALYTKAPFLQGLLDGMPESVKVIDSQFRVVYANDSARKSIGLTLNEIRGRTCYQLFYGFQDKCFFCGMKGVFESGQSQVSYCNLAVQGTPREFEVSVYPIRTSHSKIDYAVEVVKDVTSLARGGVLPRKMGKVFSRDRTFGLAFEQMAQLADDERPLLLQGEKGTGKKSVARALHQRSARAGGPFRLFHCVDGSEGNCGAALLGEGGAWEKAIGGTLYLDEISLLGGESQRLLAKKLSPPAKGRVPWVMTATCEDIGALVRQGKIHSGLYECFGAKVLRLPALRERKQDLPFLAQHFIETYKILTGSPAEKLSPAAVCQLMTYPWPGNIRELETNIERACLLAKGVEIEQLDLPVCAPQTGKLEDLLETTEKTYLVDALTKTRGRLAQTAAAANMGLKTLQRKMRKYGLNAKEFRNLSDNPSENLSPEKAI